MRILTRTLCFTLAAIGLLTASVAAYDPLKVADVRIISKTFEVTI